MKTMKIAIIGAGAMGGAIAEGIHFRDKLHPKNLIVSNPSQEKVKHLAYYGSKVTSDNREAVAYADMVILAVKPWLVQSVLEECREQLTADKILVSVAAGVSGEQLQEWLPSGPRLLRAVPNIAIAYLASMTFVTPVRATEEDTHVVADFFDGMGRVCVCDEERLTAGMALASCGLAYAFRYIRAASEGGVELGFPADEAQRIVTQTLKGAAAVLDATEMHPEAAIDRVTTPGGLTIRGLNEMEHAGFSSAVIRGLKACVGL